MYLHSTSIPGHLQHNRSDKGSASTFNHVYFKLEIPKAIAVVVVVGEEWTQLEQKQGGVWEGEVGIDVVLWYVMGMLLFWQFLAINSVLIQFKATLLI